MRILLVIAAVLAAPPQPNDPPATRELAWFRADVDLVAGFESCPAPAGLYARLQDELTFAVGAEALLPGAAALAGAGPESAVPGLRLAVRGEQAVALVPSTMDVTDGPAESALDRERRRVSELRVAYGDLALLGRGVAERSGEAAAPASPARRCAWVVARSGWFREYRATSAADVRGRSLLRSLAGISRMTVTADFSSAAMEVSLRVSAENAGEAALLADALREFVATRRRNPGAAEAVRAALDRATVRRRSEVVTLKLPLSEASLDRLRRSADSRALLRLRLAEAERERWQRVAAIVRALDLDEGDRVADVGAGEGFFSVRLARAVGPEGRVFAVDVREPAVAALTDRAKAASLSQIEAVLGRHDDPRLAASSLDAALIVNAYHEMASRDAMLARLLDALEPGGRLVLVEPWSPERRDEPLAAQVEDHLLAPELAEAELRDAGFEIGFRQDDFISGERRREWLIQARRPAAAGTPRRP